MLMMTKENDLSVRTTAESSRLPALMTADHINNTQCTHGDDVVVIVMVMTVGDDDDDGVETDDVCEQSIRMIE